MNALWPRQDLTELLGLQHPIIQAPMAGSTTPALAAAVSNAGALGSLGCASLSGAQLREQFEATRLASNRAFNINFFTHDAPRLPPDGAAAMRESLAAYYAELGLDEVAELSANMPPFDEAMLEVVLNLHPPIVSFHFGLPAQPMVDALKAAGTVILSSATTVEEARALEAAGVDAIIAQGYEAGGHRGTFGEPFEAGNVGTFALVPQVADAVSVPVIAAGGIADGRGIAAAFALGASGVQMGTAFLACPESAITPLHRQALQQARADGTRLTRAFTGRPARAIANRFVEEMAGQEPDMAPFPLQRSLTAPLNAESQKRQSTDFAVLWSGQAAALNRALPAAELVEVLVAEAQALLHR
jgi:nitronate monooxygenase